MPQVVSHRPQGIAMFERVGLLSIWKGPLWDFMHLNALVGVCHKACLLQTVKYTPQSRPWLILCLVGWGCVHAACLPYAGCSGLLSPLVGLTPPLPGLRQLEAEGLEGGGLQAAGQTSQLPPFKAEHGPRSGREHTLNVVWSPAALHGGC
jgi:hypothetical protein